MKLDHVICILVCHIYQPSTTKQTLKTTLHVSTALTTFNYNKTTNTRFYIFCTVVYASPTPHKLTSQSTFPHPKLANNSITSSNYPFTPFHK